MTKKEFFKELEQLGYSKSRVGLFRISYEFVGDDKVSKVSLRFNELSHSMSNAVHMQSANGVNFIGSVGTITTSIRLVIVPTLNSSIYKSTKKWFIR
jgi:hypothetical protein